MLNNCVIVGRLASDIVMEDNKSTLLLSVPRSYRNEQGMYETDIIKVDLSLPIAKNTAEYLKKGDLISVKGRIENHFKDNSNERELRLVAERIVFLSTKKHEEMER